jgi:CARDB
VAITVGQPNLTEYVVVSNTALSTVAITTVTALDINLGAFSSPGSTAGIYLSTDSTITTSDTLLTTLTSPGLAAVGQSGYYDAQSVQVTLPGSLAPGTYFIGGIADYNNQVAESNETDNTLNTVTINVGKPDLTAYVAASTSMVAAGASMTVTLLDINLGAFTSAPSHTSFYLSTDSTITTSDTLLKTVNAPGLAPVGNTGYYDVQSITVTPSVNLAPGTYFIGAIANSDGQVAETNTANNNLNEVQIMVGAAPQNGSSPINIASGATAEIAGASAQSVTFAGTTGMLILDSPSSFTGTVAGMAGQDRLDLVDVSFATLQGQPGYSGNSSGGTLSVTDGSHTVNIALLGNYLASTFVASSDGHGGTSIIDPPATT